jgi:hypothetical protein
MAVVRFPYRIEAGKPRQLVNLELDGLKLQVANRHV